jgi:quinol monooxygenase YgiN
MIKYTVKPERAAENETLIAQVFEQLNREKPEGLRYAAFKLDDGVNFVHVVSFETQDASNALTDLAAFRAFRANIPDRCETRPVTVELNEIGSYRLFGI